MTCACVALILSVGAERQLAMTAITHTQEAVCITYQTWIGIPSGLSGSSLRSDYISWLSDFNKSAYISNMEYLPGWATARYEVTVWQNVLCFYTCILYYMIVHHTVCCIYFSAIWLYMYVYDFTLSFFWMMIFFFASEYCKWSQCWKLTLKLVAALFVLYHVLVKGVWYTENIGISDACHFYQ